MARYSKKHYEDIAMVLRNVRKSPPINQPERKIAIRDIEVGLTALFQADNPNFNTTMFLDASGALK